MKTKMKTLYHKILFVLFSLITVPILADEPDPPPVPGAHGTGGDVAVGAPIDDNIILLLVLGTAYAAYRIYMARKTRARKLQTEEIETKQR